MAGCAQELPGTVPPEDQLHFPIGIRLVEVEVDDDGELEPERFLIVGSSNFDLRFSAGRLFSLSVNALFDMVADVDPNGSEVLFREDLSTAIIDSVRVDSFSGDLEVIMLRTSSTATAAATHILTPSRQRNELSVVQLRPNGTLSCGRAGPGFGTDRQVGYDCTDSHRIKLLGRDSFAVSVVDFFGQQLVVIGGLGAQSPAAGLFEGTASFMTSRYLEARIRGESVAFAADDDCNVNNVLLPTVRGVSGFVPLTETTTLAQLLSVAFRQSPNLSVVRHRVEQRALMPIERPPEESENGELDNRLASLCPADVEDNTLGVQSTELLRLDLAVGAIEARNIVPTSDGERAYVSIRLVDSPDTSNGGIVVLDTSSPGSVELVGVFRVGEELGQANLDERPDGSRFLYVGDQRFDLIYVIDVTTDQPAVAARIESRGIRPFPERDVQVNLLDQPSQIAFVQASAENPEQPGRRLAFVTNFSNSTLGVIDVTNPDPRAHRVIARLGRDIDPQGDQEEP